VTGAMDESANRPGPAGLVERLRGRLIVSCQAPAGHPLREPSVIARMARAAAMGGAAALRVNTACDVRAVRAITDLPVIGIHKVERGGRDLITPELHLAAGLTSAGADIVGLEATADVAREFGDPAELIARVRAELGVPVMVDVAVVGEGARAWAAGADLVATTLSGYTDDSRSPHTGPDLNLVGALQARGVRTVAEGRYSLPGQVRAAFARGAFAVVVGAAITDPVSITRRFAAVTPAAAADRRPRQVDGAPR
jgi:N-acylglucosamine-6-phosphate 2-epimerase